MYRIAALHLENGTSIRVAQVHGSPAYQDFMRKNDTSGHTNASGFCRLLSSALYHLPYAITTNVDVCRDAGVTHTKAVMAALKAATELYVGTNICYATIILDDWSEHKADIANEALAALGLYPVLPGPVPASESFVCALRPKIDPAFDEKPWTVLAIDYSIHWFKVGMYTIGEFGIVVPVQGYVGGLKVDEDNQLEALKDTLSHYFTHPPADIRLPGDLRHLVVYGDDAHNDKLHRLLAETLLGVETSIHQPRDLLQGANISSSVFDGPAYTARVVHSEMTAIHFEMRARSAFGCK